MVLDAAAFAPTNRLDLGRWGPDFVSLSFYKMFGFPTGIGFPHDAQDRVRERIRCGGWGGR